MPPNPVVLRWVLFDGSPPIFGFTGQAEIVGADLRVDTLGGGEMELIT